MSMTHPPFERLAEYAEVQPDASEWASTAQHVLTCSRCSSDVDWLRQAMTEMRADDTEPVPEVVIRRLLPLFDRRRIYREARVGGFARRLLGVLRFDSASGMTPAFGMRSGGPAPRQLLYAASPYEVDLRAEPEANGWTLSGQLLGPTQTAAGSVDLVGPDTSVQARLNEMLEFSLAPVAAGAYLLDIRLVDGTLIQITPIELGAHTD